MREAKSGSAKVVSISVQKMSVRYAEVHTEIKISFVWLLILEIYLPLNEQESTKVFIMF